MVIVDFSHLMHRNLYIAISQARPKKVKGKYITSEYMTFFYHLMLNSLRLISHKFDSGEIILALDDKNYWRKDIYPEYKGHRKKDRDKSDIDFDEFYEYVEEFINALDNYFPYYILKVDRCEADDIIGVLSKTYGKGERIVIVSSDKDMRQCIADGAEIFDPIKKEFIRMSIDEANRYKIQHTLLGDAGDNIPNVYQSTEFSDNFLKYLKNNGIYIETPYEFNELSVSEKLYNEYNIYKKNRKGEILEEKDIFKKKPFGEVKALKAANNLQNFFNEHPSLKENYEKNAKLVLFDNIPQDIKDKIIKAYEELEFKYNPNEIMNFLMKNNLRKLLMDITDFYTVQKKKENVLEEWV